MYGVRTVYVGNIGQVRMYGTVRGSLEPVRTYIPPSHIRACTHKLRLISSGWVNVRFAPASVHSPTRFPCPLSANSRLANMPSLLVHHLMVDNLKSLGRQAEFTSVRVVHKSNHSDYRAKVERDKPTQYPMSIWAKVEQP